MKSLGVKQRLSKEEHRLETVTANVVNILQGENPRMTGKKKG